MDFKTLPIISATIVFILLFASFISSYQPANDANNTSSKPRAELKNLKHIRDYLKKVNKPAVKTIKSPDGDLIDCVPSDQQPAFDHPLLKGQKPKNPPEIPKWVTSQDDTFEESFQVWTKSGESCPENTVPIRRTTEEDVLRASSAQTFGRKPRPVRKAYINRKYHEHAIVYTDWGAYYGASATIDLWAPSVENPGEFSLAQIWLQYVDNDGNAISSIEAGWHVSPDLYDGDPAPRLFVYWTDDGYDETGCYNLLCQGFVHKSHKIVPGAAHSIGQVSTYGGTLFGLPFYVHKDGTSGDWWLFAGDETVGYWPHQFFPNLNKRPVNLVELGGEVVNLRSRRGAHTKTQMGNGHFAEEGYKNNAASFRRIKIFNKNNDFTPADRKKLKWKTFTEKGVEKCYTVTGVQFDKFWGDFFFYGGPGGSDGNCK